MRPCRCSRTGAIRLRATAFGRSRLSRGLFNALITTGKRRVRNLRRDGHRVCRHGSTLGTSRNLTVTVSRRRVCIALGWLDSIELSLGVHSQSGKCLNDKCEGDRNS